MTCGSKVQGRSIAASRNRSRRSEPVWARCEPTSLSPPRPDWVSERFVSWWNQVFSSDSYVSGDSRDPSHPKWLSVPRRLEQFDGITRGVLQQNLPASVARHDLVPEPMARRLEPFDHAREIVHLDLDAVPPAWGGNTAIRHGLACAACSRPIEQKMQVAARQRCEAGRWVHLDLETKCSGVERNGGVHVVNNVSDSHDHLVLPARGKSTALGNALRQACDCRPVNLATATPQRGQRSRRAGTQDKTRGGPYRSR